MYRDIKSHGFWQIIVLFAVIALVFAGCSNPTAGSGNLWPDSPEMLTPQYLLELLLGCGLEDNGDGTFTIPATPGWDETILVPDGFTITPENSGCIKKDTEGENEKIYLDLKELADGEEVSLGALGLIFTIAKNGSDTVVTLPGDINFVIVKEADGSFTLKKTDRQLVEDFMASLTAKLQDEYVKNDDNTWSLEFLYDEGAGITLPIPNPIFPGDLVVSVNGAPVDPEALPVEMDIAAGKTTEIVIKVTLNKEEDSVTLLVTRGPFIPITEITLSPSEVTLILGREEGEASFNISAVIGPVNATRPSEYEWISSDPDVALVDNGKITAVSRGMAEITARSVNQESSPIVTSGAVTITVLDLGIRNLNASYTKEDGNLEIKAFNPDYSISLEHGRSAATIIFEKDEKTNSSFRVETGLHLTDSKDASFAVGSLKVGKNKVFIILSAEDNNGISYEKEYTLTIIQQEADFVPVTGIALSAAELNLTIGQPQYLYVIKLEPDNATNKTYFWISSDDSIASVDQNGKVSAHKSGTTEIWAKANDTGGFESAHVTVIVKSGDKGIGEFTVNGGQLTGTAPNFALNVGTGKTVTLNFSKPRGATAAYQAGSASGSFDDPDEQSCAFTVDNLAVGDTVINITITAENGSKETYTLTITRNATPVTGITIIPSSLTLTAGGEAGSLAATVTPADASNKSVIWSSLTPSIATVDKDTGIVTPLARGEASIRAEAADGSGAYATRLVIVKSGDAVLTGLRVNNTPVSGVSPDFTANAGTGATAAVSFTLPAAATAVYAFEGASVTISGSSFTVNNLKVGENTVAITVTAENGGTAAYTLTITRNATPVTGINFSVNTLTLKTPGAAEKISATVLPAGATNPALEWTSSNDSVATVAQDGTVTAVAAGTATITAKATDDSNVTRTATVTVQSWDNSLTGLQIAGASVSGNSPDFSASVASNISSVTVSFTRPQGATAVYAFEGASVTISGSSFTVNNLKAGENKIIITITAQNGSQVDYKLTVTRDPTLVGSISLSPDPLILKSQGATGTFAVTMLPSGVTNPALNWETSAPSVATVNQSGTVTAVGVGTATITAKAADGSGISGTATVTVQSWDASLGDLRVNGSAVSGNSNDFSASVENADATVTVSFTKYAKASAEYKNILAGGSATAITGSSFTVSLTPGPNAFAITVTAENGIAKEVYNLVITRRGSGSVILEWDDSGQTLIIPGGVLTLSKNAGDKVTLIGPANAGTYMWVVDADYRNPVSREQNYTFDSAIWALGKYSVSLWVSTSIGGDTVEITVVK